MQSNGDGGDIASGFGDTEMAGPPSDERAREMVEAHNEHVREVLAEAAAEHEVEARERAMISEGGPAYPPPGEGALHHHRVAESDD